jgi:hypothetical protein
MDQDINYSFYYWGPYLWKSKLPESFCDEMLAEGLALNNNHNDHLASIISDTRYFDTEKHYNKFLAVTEPYFACYLESKKSYAKVDRDPQIKLDSLWINFQEKNEFNPEHTHTGDLSFVIYLSVPEGIVKENNEYVGASAGPGAVHFRYGEQSNWSVSQHKFVPEKCDFYIFPAMLAHSAYPFKSDGTRISISGNLIFQYD